MRKLRVLALMHEDFVPPDSIDGLTDEQIAPFKTEYDVVAGLEELRHDIRILGVSDDLAPVRQALTEYKPHLVFNLLEEFRGIGSYVSYVLGYLELMRQAYTGCNPRGLILSVDKVLSKRILRHHRIPVPDFAVFDRGARVRRPSHLHYPVIVKSATEHGSVGITQASIVHDDDKLREQVEFVRDELETGAIVEHYIEGRELYVGVIGNIRLQTLPVWEMLFRKLPEGQPRIATEKVKWDFKYQRKIKLITKVAKHLPNGAEARINKICKRAYRALGQTGYARMDLRLTEDGSIYLLESNPNPQLAYGEDLAESAHHAGMKYEQLIQRILTLGLRYHKSPRH